jgi:hypothetical protein
MATREEIRKRPNYVDNKKFLAAMIDFRNSVIEAEKNEQQRPQVPYYVAECIMKIATHLSYTFREEMISDGIENSLQYIDNFDPEKSQNPFAYFTQIIYYAFLRRIQKEKKYLYTKYKATENANLLGETADRQEQDIGKDYNDGIKQGEWSEEYMSNFIENFEETKRKKRNKKRRTVIEDE